MKLLNYKISAQQVEATQSRRFSLGQYMVAVSVLLLSVTAISYAAGLLTLKSFNAGAPISSTDVNANFQSINDTLRL